jgi:protein-tyrosine kinase
VTLSIIEQAIHRVRSGATADRPVDRALGAKEVAALPAGEFRLGEAALSGQVLRLDMHALQVSGLVADESQRQRQLQEFKGIKRALLSAVAAASDRPCSNIVAVTSAVSGEGKTYVSFNLAFSLASELDTRVLLVDTDFLRRDLTRKLGMSSACGLSDLLRDKSISMTAAIVATDIPQLYFLPAGGAVDNSAELLASSRMKEIASVLAEGAGRQLTILDAPPVLLTPDAVAVTTTAGHVLLVVRALVSQRAEVSEAVRRIDADEKLLGVLNASVSVGPFKRSYGYEYYGNYGDV